MCGMLPREEELTLCLVHLDFVDITVSSRLRIFPGNWLKTLSTLAVVYFLAWKNVGEILTKWCLLFAANTGLTADGANKIHDERELILPGGK